MNFFQTQMGHHFYNRQIPKLIEALERIADGLSGSAPAMKSGVIPDGALLNSLNQDYYVRMWKQIRDNKITKRVWQQSCPERVTYENI